uniref:BED-type domain-containing protein n=2 Tax=Heliothis virescens TaxID=7102 RepID=A0A2A4J3N7_HELVI
MERNKPPDPDPPDISDFAPLSPNFPLSQFADVACSIANIQNQPLSESLPSSNQNRKRPGDDVSSPSSVPAKQQRNQIGRSRYSATDKAPFIVHVSRLEPQPNAGSTLHPVTFGMFLLKNNIANIVRDGVKKVGRNRVSVEFSSPQDANSFIINAILSKNSYVAAIPTFNITRMGVVTGVPSDISEEEAKTYLSVPSGCGQILKVRRINRKIFRDGITEFKPTETCVITFDGQVLPNRIYCCYTSLPVVQYVYPTIQCRKCCRFGHVELVCRSKPRCCKCGHDHPGDGCNISESEAFCVLCSGNHFANSKSCPEHGRQKAIKTIMAEKSLSYAEVSKTIPPASRSYANAAKSSSQSQSYRKTVFLKPKTHAPLSPSYDKAAHQRIVNSPSPSQPDGCALNNPFVDSNNISSLTEILIKVLTWGSNRCDAFGKGLAEILDDLNLCILNDGCPTRRSLPGQQKSCKTSPPLLKYNLSKPDWSRFASLLEEKINDLPNLSSTFPHSSGHCHAKSCYDGFISAITFSADSTFPLRNCARNKIPSPPWWDQDCTSAIRDRKEAEQQYNEAMNNDNLLQYRRVYARSQRLFRKKKRRGWVKFCTSLSPSTPVSAVWKSINRFRRGCSPSISSPITRQTAESFFDRIAPAYVPLSSEFVQSPVDSSDDPLDNPFTMDELNAVGNTDAAYKRCRSGHFVTMTLRHPSRSRRDAYTRGNELVPERNVTKITLSVYPIINLMDYEEVPSRASDKTSVWHYFLRARDKVSAKCKKCQKILKCVGGSTSGLQKHLKNVHQITGEKQVSITESHGEVSNMVIPSTSSEDIPKKKTKVTDYYESDTNPSMQLMIARMTSMNGYSFRTFIECEDLRTLFLKSGHKLPLCADTIRNIVVKEADKIKRLLKAEIQNLLKEHHKFSISFDEWTSIRNRRYLSLNLHSHNFSGGNKFKNLGLIRIYGSLPAKKCVEEIKRKLDEFGVSLEKDIVAETTDGCSMMTKFGKFLSSYHQKCIAHALQLAIADVFYKKSEALIANAAEELEEDDDDDLPLSVLVRQAHQSNTHNSASDNDSDDDEDGAEFSSNAVTTTSEVSEQQFVYHDLIAKVKKVVKIFRKSPTKNDNILQKYVVDEFGREYSLTCDAITRWSSLANTLERFLKLKNCIVKALIDLKVQIIFSDSDWKDLEQFHEILDIVKTVLEALCRRDATLLTADVAIKFALNKLSNIDTHLSRKMISALKTRYTQRRLIEASILNYLQNPDTYFANVSDEDLSVFPRPNSNEMCNKIVLLLKRTSPPLLTTIQPNQIIEIEEDSELSAERSNLTKGEELNAELKKICRERVVTQNDDIETNVRIEMALFENGGDRGRHLSKAFDHLLTIPPTSVEPERIFSSAGLICNKIRSRLGDVTLDALIFLRTHYNEKKRAVKTK